MATLTSEDRTITPNRPDWPQQADGRGATLDLRDEHPGLVQDDEVVPRRRRGRRVLQVLGWLAAAIILGAVAVVAGVNTTDEVRLDLAFDTMRVPIWAIIAVATAAGFVAGRFLDNRRC